MCTSFMINSPKTIIGMNYDGTDEIKIMLKEDNQFLILLKVHGQFFHSFGINKSGIFMNTLMVTPNEQGKYRRGKNVIHMMKFFEHVMGETVKFQDLEGFLQTNTIVNVPNFNVHSMIVGKSGDTYIVEPGISNFHNSLFSDGPVVLTNFPMCHSICENYKEAKGTGEERYKKAYSMILEKNEAFSIEDGFAVLKETMQLHGEYPTRFSMVSILEDEEIYFATNGDFSKVFKFTFEDKKIITHMGFEKSNSSILSKKGILVAELENF
ncbi:linear amide C-N hydrolase [Clostridium sp.]|uniref:linear amide C-N hydrolase n=1 Tax=Clostridium sp. TaxID=1506 RepID=UPI002FC8A407